METQLLHVQAFGVAFTIRFADPALAGAVAAVLPPGHAPAAASEALAELSLEREEDLGALDAGIRQLIATHAPALVFVHAGVVAHRGRALVAPAASFAGKTELVAALVRAGATYYSDEFAVLDGQGLVHPYARRLSLRERGTRDATDVGAEELGGRTGTAPAPLGLVAATRYEPGATWDPAPRSAAAGALLLLEHAGQAREHPERVLDTLHRAVRGALVLEGPRGEAAAAAASLLAAMDALG